jgi:hypothetical protein
MLIIELVITVIETFVCGISLTMVFAIIARLGFVGKLFGMGVKLSVMVVLELISIFVNPFWWFVFKHPFNWIVFLVTLLLSAISSFVMWYDEMEYIYIEEEIIE